MSEAKHLSKIAKKPGALPIIVGSKLVKAGYAEKAEGSAVEGRGYSMYQITDAGRKLLA